MVMRALLRKYHLVEQTPFSVVLSINRIRNRNEMYQCSPKLSNLNFGAAGYTFCVSVAELMLHVGRWPREVLFSIPFRVVI